MEIKYFIAVVALVFLCAFCMSPSAEDVQSCVEKTGWEVERCRLFLS